MPARLVLKRSVTRKPVAVWRTIGRPSELRTGRVTPPPPPPAGAGRKDADTDFAVSSVSTQVSFFPCARHALPHPPNVFPAAARAVSVTLRPLVYFCVHVFVGPTPMHLPAGADTVPLPVIVIVSVPGASRVKFALTDLAEVKVTVHVGLVPEHAPVQPVKDAPGAGVAVSVTAEPVGRLTVQAEAPFPQLIPPPLTVPLPVTLTES
jgi:hypothetical protein